MPVSGAVQPDNPQMDVSYPVEKSLSDLLQPGGNEIVLYDFRDPTADSEALPASGGGKVIKAAQLLRKLDLNLLPFLSFLYLYVNFHPYIILHPQCAALSNCSFIGF